MLIEKLSLKLIEKLAAEMTSRISSKRAKLFLETFEHEVMKEIRGQQGIGEADIVLQNILESEKTKECLFEACRSVFISKSRNISPIAIAFLSTRIAVEKRDPDFGEMLAYEALEAMNDDELTAFHKEFSKAIGTPGFISRTTGTPRRENGQIILHEDTNSSFTGKTGREKDVSQFNMDLLFGSWARKLQTAGLMSSKTVIGFNNLEIAGASETENKSGGLPEEIKTTAMISGDAFILFDVIDRALKHQAVASSTETDPAKGPQT